MKKKTTQSAGVMPLPNKYVLVASFFIVWVLFVDKHSVIKQRSLNKTIANLEQEIVQLEQKYEVALKTKKDIEENPERYARNHYYMHRPDETVFVIKK